ncbi:uncharacterized protein LOC134237139 [Saccostrea cucullata]|uniref:uncharacterized protein LOC134237139 n=1 Tax=Saccostrea cuccullata TaxID=36930 RepID=UPI002ED2E70F
MDSTSPSRAKTDMQLMSEYQYRSLCQDIGTSKVIDAKRDLMDISEVLQNQALGNGDVFMGSGSNREGFRLQGSDVDSMFWPDNHRVIWDLSQSFSYKIQRKTLILSDSSDSPPGYTLLYLLSPSLNQEVQKACVKMDNKHYISSSKYIQSKCSPTYLNSNPRMHGPCISKSHGILDIDYAYGFFSDFWPPSASSWTERSHSWPKPHIVDDVLKSGCHFVAIGHELGRHEHNEWRISFSLAERKLVYSMNHCQFITYGLLKFFLKKIINDGQSDDDKLLRSYHMKTAIFWVLQQNAIPEWTPQNLLECFWVCFKQILKWVYEGVCPNFFIPNNNMFLKSIHGKEQHVLFIRLYKLYEQGVLECLFIKSCEGCQDILQNHISICTDEDSLISEADFDVKLFEEIFYNDTLPALNAQMCLKYLYTIEQSIGLPLSKYQVIVVQRHTCSILQKLAFILHMDSLTQKNKRKYRADKLFCQILKFAASFGCITDMLFIAIYYYKTYRYMKALFIINLIRIKLARPYVIQNFDEVPEMYSMALGSQSWSTKMRHAVAWNIKLHNKMPYISELIPEHQSSLRNDIPSLMVPPFILLNMLEILCYNHTDPMKAQKNLYILKINLLLDEGYRISTDVSNIAWHILGMCQQMTGHFQDALYSYQQSLREDQLHSIKTATEKRILEILEKNF